MVVLQANPPQFDRVEDVASLRYLNESSVLHTLRQRYGSNLIHTNAGTSLLVLNPMHPLAIYSEKVRATPLLVECMCTLLVATYMCTRLLYE